MALNIPTTRNVICSLLGIGWFIVLPIQAVEAEDRVAFVIGNASYKEEFSLKNPINDALAVSGVLKKFGFETIERNDLRTSQVNELRQSLEDRINRDSILFFFYAGHALQIDGRNYLAPVDANFDTSAAIENESLYLGDILSIIEKRRPKLAVVILDACRDNPFKNEKNASIGKGLARVDPPSSTVVFYATRPGGVASDGSGENGLFTQALLNEVSDPKASLEVLFRRVSTSVYKTSKGEQEPWIEGVIRQEFTIARLEPGSLPSVSGKIERDLSISPTLPDAVDETVLANDASREELISQAKENLLTVDQATSLVLAETEPEDAVKTVYAAPKETLSLTEASTRALNQYHEFEETLTSYYCKSGMCMLYREVANLDASTFLRGKQPEAMGQLIGCPIVNNRADCSARMQVSTLSPIAFIPGANRGHLNSVQLRDVRATTSGGLAFKGIFDASGAFGVKVSCDTAEGGLEFHREYADLRLARSSCFGIGPTTWKFELNVLLVNEDDSTVLVRWRASGFGVAMVGSGEGVAMMQFR